MNGCGDVLQNCCLLQYFWSDQSVGGMNGLECEGLQHMAHVFDGLHFLLSFLGTMQAGLWSPLSVILMPFLTHVFHMM